MIQSVMQERGHVTFPAFANERHYMVPFKKALGLPRHVRHWQPTVDAMLRDVETDNPIYLMIDQRVVPAGETHRRPGVHVDGYWVPNLKAHGGGHLGHGRGVHRGGHVGSHASGRWDTPNNNWKHVDFSEPEALILASNVVGARAYTGGYSAGSIGEGGAFKGVMRGFDTVEMMDHRVYVGTVGTLHESMPVMRECERTVVRLNCPGVTVQ